MSSGGLEVGGVGGVGWGWGIMLPMPKVKWSNPRKSDISMYQSYWNHSYQSSLHCSLPSQHVFI